MKLNFSYVAGDEFSLIWRKERALFSAKMNGSLCKEAQLEQSHQSQQF